MEDNKSAKLYNIGKILLGLAIIISILGVLLLIFISFVAYTTEGYINDDFAIGCYGGQLILLITAFFTVKKYRIAVGGLIMGIGVIFLYIAISGYQYFSKMYVFYSNLFVSFYLLVDGCLFIRSGIINRRNKKKVSTPTATDLQNPSAPI